MWIGGKWEGFEAVEGLKIVLSQTQIHKFSVILIGPEVLNYPTTKGSFINAVTQQRGRELSLLLLYV